MDHLRVVCATYARVTPTHTVHPPYRTPGYGDPRAPVPFVIFSQPRSGTKLTETLLVHNHRIKSRSEAFHPGSIYGLGRSHWTVSSRDANRVVFMDHVLTDKRNRSVGFLAQPGHLTFAEVAALALASNIRKIVLHRENVLDMYVSVRKAQRMGVWGNADTTAMKVTVLPHELRKYIRMVESNHRCLSAAHSLAAASGSGGETHQPQSFTPCG